MRGVWEKGTVQTMHYDQHFKKWMYKIQLTESKKIITKVEESALQTYSVVWSKSKRSKYDESQILTLVCDDPFEEEKSKNSTLHKYEFNSFAYGWKIQEESEQLFDNEQIEKISEKEINEGDIKELPQNVSFISI